MNARQGVLTPFSLLVVGLLTALLATLLVFQSQTVSTAPAGAADTATGFEPKSGELIMDQAPYVGGILGFVVALLNRIFNRIFGGASPIGGGPLAGAGGGPHVTQPNQTNSTGNTGSSAPAGASQTGGQTQTVQTEPAPEPEPEPEPQSLAQRIKCNVFGALGRSC